MAECFRQDLLWQAKARNLQSSFDKQAMARRFVAEVADLVGKKQRYSLSLIVSERHPVQSRLLFIGLESVFRRRRILIFSRISIGIREMA